MTLVVRAIDSGGNVAVGTPVNLTYQAIPPHVIGITPAPGSATQLAVSTITLNFDEALDRSKVTTAVSR